MITESAGVVESITVEVVRPSWTQMLLLGRGSLLDYLLIAVVSGVLIFIGYRQVNKWKARHLWQQPFPQASSHSYS